MPQSFCEFKNSRTVLAWQLACRVTAQQIIITIYHYVLNTTISNKTLSAIPLK